MTPAHIGQLAHVWADEHSIHIQIAGKLVKTVASNLTAADLHEIRLRGASPAGAPPATMAAARNATLPGGAVVEVDRSVDSSGTCQLGSQTLAVGSALASKRVTLRLDGHLVHVICQGILAKTLPCPIAADQRGRLRGARLAAEPLPPPPAGSIQVERRVPAEGVVMVTRQRIRVGRTYRQDRHHPHRGHLPTRPAQG
jgi:hypothetical protein